MQIKIEVLYNDEPKVGKSVEIYVDDHDKGLLDYSKGGSYDAYTDDDGIAEFDTCYDEYDYIVVKINGERWEYDDPYDGCSYTINL